MSSDQIVELDHFRARRDRDRRVSEPSAAEAPQSTEQADAIARARESWLLSQLGREAHGRPGPDEEASADAVDQGRGLSAEDD